MIPFFNPWSWYIYNDKMPSMPTPEPKFVAKAAVVFLGVTALFGAAMFKIPMYMRHKFDSIDAFGISALAIIIVYFVLLYICLRKFCK